MLSCYEQGFVWVGMLVASEPSNLHRLGDEVSVSCASEWHERKIDGTMKLGLTYSQSHFVMKCASDGACFANMCRRNHEVTQEFVL